VNTRVSGICLTNHSPSSEKGFTLALDWCLSLCFFVCRASL
jgi:hypothetical protein